MNTPVYVVGGGIIGLLTAYELGKVVEEVVLIDRQPVGVEASWAAGGILSPLYPWRYPVAVHELAAWSQTHYRQLIDELKAQSGIDAEHIQSGLLIVDEPDLDKGANWCRNHAIVANILDSSGIANLEPNIRLPSKSALHLPNVAQVRNPRFLKALISSIRAQGTQLIEDRRVTGFEASRGQLVAIQTDTGIIPADRCVLAAGAWSSELLIGTGLELPITPVKGQMLLLRGSEPAPFDHILLRDGCYLVPRKDGLILAGSTQEDTGFDKSTTDAARNMLLSKAVGIAPSLKKWSIEHQWAGLRPGSPDGVPFIGPHPEIQGLFINTGHFRNGIVMAPASARLAVDMVLGRTPFLDLCQFRVSRK